MTSVGAPIVGPWPGQPVIYELNALAWVRSWSQRLGRTLTLAELPDEAWDEVTSPGIDAVWLMGVWQRSEAGRVIALADPVKVAEFESILGEVSDPDVVGSAYCVADYEVDDLLGGRSGLASARAALATRGVRLVVDFVPNHVSPDHPWLSSHPDRFVAGDDDDLEREPAGFLANGDAVIACGRDPYFPPWSDVAQLNAFSPHLRAAVVDTLRGIAEQADGVRCDMAMLLLNDVFARTWGDRVGPVPVTEYWTEVIGAVRAEAPNFLFMAEAYWDLESRLIELGFDHCYDKRLYDRVVHDGAGAVRDHLAADVAHQEHLVRFIENHDEPRAAAAFGPDQERAAAVVVATLPGATLWHQGQFEGRQIRLPVFLTRWPDETSDDALVAFHRQLLSAAAGLRHGRWEPAVTSGWPDNATFEQLMSWTWTGEQTRSLIVVNLSDQPASAMVHPSWADLAGRPWVLDDLLNGAQFERDGDDVAANGLFVALPPWGTHVLSWAPRSDALTPLS